MTEALQQLVEQVSAARRAGNTLRIRGGDSKAQIIGRDCEADTELAVAGYQGVSDYQPRELVLSARAGSCISDLQALLAKEGQTLPFDPPPFAGRATLGGTLACNVSGPGRPWLGSVRDAVLGVQLINGEGQLLEFGGKVMKNVAGYDVSRLQAGALGTLGVITQVHLKVLPLPECSLTLAYETSADDALRQMAEKTRLPKPLTGACWLDGHLYLRLAGARQAVQHTASSWTSSSGSSYGTKPTRFSAVTSPCGGWQPMSTHRQKQPQPSASTGPEANAGCGPNPGGFPPVRTCACTLVVTARRKFAASWTRCSSGCNCG